MKKKLTWVGEMNLQWIWKDWTLGNESQRQIKEIKWASEENITKTSKSRNKIEDSNVTEDKKKIWFQWVLTTANKKTLNIEKTWFCAIIIISSLLDVFDQRTTVWLNYHILVYTFLSNSTF